MNVVTRSRLRKSEKTLYEVLTGFRKFTLDFPACRTIGNAVKKVNGYIKWVGLNEMKQPVHVFFILPKNNKCKLLKEVVTSLSKTVSADVQHVIFVNDELREKINYQVVVFLERRFAKFEVFTYAETQYNILNNFLVPRYRKLSESEKKCICDSKGHELLYMQVSDPVAHLLGLKVHDVVEAKVASTISVEVIKYRRVVSSF